MSVRLTPSLDKLIEQVKQANEQRTCLSIKGHGTKRFLGSSVKSIELSTQSLDQIISYDPSELVVTVQAGVSLLELEALLAESGQRLSFEPPLFMSQDMPSIEELSRWHDRKRLGGRAQAVVRCGSGFSVGFALDQRK